MKELRFKELKKLVIQHLEIDIDYLLDILRFLGNMKTLNISVVLSVTSDLGGKYLVFGSSRSVKMREADQKRLERSL